MINIQRNYKTSKLHSDFDKYSKEELKQFENQLIKVTGRIFNKRGQGKTCFLDLHDFFGKIQLYLNKNAINDEKIFSKINDISVGDFFYAQGFIMKTNKGELTINVNNFHILKKAINSLPEKFHGLKNIEEKYRKKYLDLLTNKESLEKAKKRIEIINLIRKFFSEKEYYEVETPILQSIYGGAAAQPFITKHNSLDQNFFLRIATEIPLKKLIIGGFERIYEMGRIFRNEGISHEHNPEFTSLEAYEAYGNLETMKLLVKNLFQYIGKNAFNSDKLKYQDMEIDISDNSWKSIPMKTLIKKYAKVDFDQIKTFNEAKLIALKHNFHLEKHHNSIGFIIELFFEHYVEKHLINPTFITDFPVEISPFAKLKEDDVNFTQRFELFIGKKECANAYNEINDANEQEKRFINQEKQKKLGNIEASSYDKDFIEAIKYGMPPCGGIGIGIDRMIMLFTNSKTIKEVILFPTLKAK